MDHPRYPMLLLLAFAIMLIVPNDALGEDIELVSSHDLCYGDPGKQAQRLDIHHVATHGSRPAVIWIHGGGWRGGDKKSVQLKPSAFNRRGVSFVSVNYRMHPQVTVDEMASDIAAAVAWVIEHAEENWIDPDRLILAGHSAGAHLAALVATDHSYLKRHGVSAKQLVGCIPVDTAAYDVPSQIQSIPARRRPTYVSIFGQKETTQKRWSPISHVESGIPIPPFLILHVADRTDSTAQSKAFGQRLKEAGVPVRVVGIEGKTHGSINRDLGRSGDASTRAVERFLDKVIPTTANQGLSTRPITDRANADQ